MGLEQDRNRQTGRTTRMIEKAASTALALTSGQVVVVVSSAKQHAYIKSMCAGINGFHYINFWLLSNIDKEGLVDWNTMNVIGGHDIQVFFDAYVLEVKFPCLFDAYHEFDGEPKIKKVFEKDVTQPFNKKS